MTNPDGILKSRDITLLTKVHIVRAMFFPVVIYGFESWTIKTERWRIDAFELWYWRRFLRVPWVAWRSNQSILKEIFIGRTDAESKVPKLWPPVVKSWLIRKDPDAGKDWRQEKGTEDKMVGLHHYWLDGHVFEKALGTGDEQGSLVCCSPWVAKSQTQFSNWTTTIAYIS